ncbi:hypothetical protein HK100_010314 [Physocladia obscura]|uniref:Uncharacterized protein n=1 Tax=Physocladia obscura TaxID=109957 RepID=A0AAD5T339_9FUNG|nr:hypothetical protein HK100_010314 [Physocladia obscura]
MNQLTLKFKSSLENIKSKTKTALAKISLKRKASTLAISVESSPAKILQIAKTENDAPVVFYDESAATVDVPQINQNLEKAARIDLPAQTVSENVIIAVAAELNILVDTRVHETSQPHHEQRFSYESIDEKYRLALLESELRTASRKYSFDVVAVNANPISESSIVQTQALAQVMIESTFLEPEYIDTEENAVIHRFSYESVDVSCRDAIIQSEVKMALKKYSINLNISKYYV